MGDIKELIIGDRVFQPSDAPDFMYFSAGGGALRLKVAAKTLKPGDVMDFEGRFEISGDVTGTDFLKFAWYLGRAMGDACHGKPYVQSLLTQSFNDGVTLEIKRKEGRL